MSDLDANHLGPFHAGAGETERQAAIANFPRSGSQRRRVYDAIVAAGDDGATREELAATLNMAYTTVLPRVTELKNRGLVCESGRTRPTVGGSPANVVVVADGQPTDAQETLWSDNPDELGDAA